MATNLPRPLPNYTGVPQQAMYEALSRPPQRGLAASGAPGAVGLTPRKFQRQAKYGKAWNLGASAGNQMPGKSGKAQKMDAAISSGVIDFTFGSICVGVPELLEL